MGRPMGRNGHLIAMETRPFTLCIAMTRGTASLVLTRREVTTRCYLPEKDTFGVGMERKGNIRKYGYRVES